MKRFLASLLTIAMLATMFAGLTVSAADAADVKTYADVNFEDWTAGSQQFASGANGWAGAWKNNTIQSYPDSYGKILAIPNISTATANYYVRYRLPVDANYSECQVLWSEISVKYTGGFTAFGFGENTSANCILVVTPDGKVARNVNTGYNKGIPNNSIINSAQLEVGKWYHFVTALDFTDANASSGAPLYIWMNGELIENGGKYTSFSPTKNWSYHKLWVNEAPVEGVSVFFDNVRVYQTAALDNHAENPVIADANDEDAVAIYGNYIIGASELTVEKTKAAFTNSDSIRFIKDGTVLKDDEAVAGSTLYTTLANEKGFRTYEIADEYTQLFSERHADVNFDNWNSGQDYKTSDGTSISMSWAGTVSALSPVSVPEKSGKVLKISNVPPYDGTSSGYYARYRINSVDANYSNCKVLWSEFSIKYEGGFKKFGFGENTSANCIMGIDTDGRVTKFIPNAGYKGQNGTVIGTEKLELGKWYHFVAALDFTDAAAAEKGAPLYIWMNGELIENGGRSASFKSTNGWSYHKFWVAKYGSDTASIYLDNLKIYETLSIDKHAEKDFDITVTDANENDAISIDSSVIVAPADITVAQVKGAIAADNYVFVKDGTVIADEAAAQDAIVTIKADNPMGMKQYTVGVHGPAINRLCPAGTGAVNYVSTGIPCKSDYLSIDRLTDNDISKDYQYKTLAEIDSGELKIMVNLNALYTLSKVVVHERYIGNSLNNVTVELGKNGVLTKVVDDQPLSRTWSSSTNYIVANEYSFDPTEADTIIFTLRSTNNYDDPAEKNANSTYEIAELEAYGYKSGDVTVTGIIPEYSFGVASNQEFVIGFANGTDNVITGKILVAAYEGDELVAITPARDIGIGKGASANYTLALQGIIADGRTYKAFVWDNLDADHPKPIFKSEIITK